MVLFNRCCGNKCLFIEKWLWNDAKFFTNREKKKNFKFIYENESFLVLERDLISIFFFFNL